MRPRLFLAVLLGTAVARAADAPPPPAVTTRIEESVALPSPKAREPEPEVDAIKVRLNGEYEARQSFLTALPVAAIGPRATGRESLGQTSRLYHWLRLRGLVLVDTHWEVRAEADAPHGMLYGQELDNVAYSGSDFERIQPFRMQPRVLKLTLRGQVGEVSLGHTTTQLGMGLIDADGDQPRYFGGREFAASYERLQLLSGTADSTLRVGAAGDLLYDDGRLSLSHDDRLLRVGLSARYAPSRGSHLNLLARYEALGKKSDRAGAQAFVLDLSGSFRRKIRGHSGEVFADYEAAYRVGTVNEPTDFATGGEQTLAAAAFALRGGVALEREHDYRRYAHFVASLEWGMASGDADPTDDELHRFVMNPNHGVGLLLFSEVLRFKTARAEASLESSRGNDGARLEGLPTRGGVAGASYLNPVLLYRPDPDLTLKLGAVVATATSGVVDPSKLAATGARSNFDGGSPFGRSLGSELDFGAELSVPLSPPSALRLSVEGAVAFPGSAFDDADGHGLGTQAMTTLGAGVTF
ncbi:MAG TPA: hypothetical protein VHB79_13545 [Polyangiaceae bacterium]|nr:hypothetical protein [Polyangiaceae bacterium]